MSGRSLTCRKIDQISKYMKNKGAELLTAAAGSYKYEKGETWNELCCFELELKISLWLMDFNRCKYIFKKNSSKCMCII